MPTLHGLILHRGDVLEARRWHVPVLANLLLLLMARGATGGGRRGERAGPPQSGPQRACETPRPTWFPAVAYSLQRERVRVSRTQAWAVGDRLEGRCLGQGWVGREGQGARVGEVGWMSGWGQEEQLTSVHRAPL